MTFAAFKMAFRGGVLALALMISAPSFATCTVPNTLVDGTTADAAPVNTNFTTLAACVNAIPTATLPAASATQVYVGTGSAGTAAVGPTIANTSAANALVQANASGLIDSSFISGGGGGGNTPSFRNLLIGGDASTNPWQRGTSITPISTTQVTTANTTPGVNTDGGDTIVDPTYTLLNGQTISTLGLYSSVAATIEMKIFLDNGSRSLTYQTGQSFSHSGGGWQWVTLTTPFAVPASGSYRVGVFTSTNIPANTTSGAGSNWYVSGDVNSGTTTFGSGSSGPWITGYGYSTTAPAYTADRFVAWGAHAASSLTVSKQSSGLTGFPNTFRLQRTSGNTDTGVLGLGQVVETVNVTPYQGKTLTLSFQARAGASYSASGAALAVKIATGTGIDQGSAAFIAGTWTGYSAGLSATDTLTTSFQTFTHTIAVPSNATELAVSFSYTPSGTAGTNDYFDLATIELDAYGAPSFEVLPADVVKMRCRRYTVVGSFYVPGAMAQLGTLNMRVTPSVSGGGGGFTSTGTTMDSLMGYQTTGGAVTLTLNSEL